MPNRWPQNAVKRCASLVRCCRRSHLAARSMMAIWSSSGRPRNETSDGMLLSASVPRDGLRCAAVALGAASKSWFRRFWPELAQPPNFTIPLSLMSADDAVLRAATTDTSNVLWRNDQRCKAPRMHARRRTETWTAEWPQNCAACHILQGYL